MRPNQLARVAPCGRPANFFLFLRFSHLFFLTVARHQWPPSRWPLLSATIVDCLLPSAYCLLPSAYCLLPSAYCLLPSAYCLLILGSAYGTRTRDLCLERAAC